MKRNREESPSTPEKKPRSFRNRRPAADPQETLISSFLEIAVGQTSATAREFLEARSWSLDEAIELFYDNNTSFSNNVGMTTVEVGESSNSVVPFRNFQEEEVNNMERIGDWDNTSDNLASLYRPPFDLMFTRSFEEAKRAAIQQDKWLLINLQSTIEFASHMLNRDTWANKTVAETIKSNFIFWQVNDDTEEGKKVCTYYRLDSCPVVMVIDPITGQKLCSWIGMIQPETLLEDLICFTDGSPKNLYANLCHRKRSNSIESQDHGSDEDEEENTQQDLAASMKTGQGSIDEDVKETTNYLPLPEEDPKVSSSLLCRVGIRFPDGSRIQRNFLRSDSIQLLWSFCCCKLEEAKTRPFRLANAIPGRFKYLEYDANLSFEESRLQNCMISLVWD